MLNDGQSLPESERAGWAPEFLERLRDVDNDAVEAVDDMLEDVKQARRSKPARRMARGLIRAPQAGMASEDALAPV